MNNLVRVTPPVRPGPLGSPLAAAIAVVVVVAVVAGGSLLYGSLVGAPSTPAPESNGPGPSATPAPSPTSLPSPSASPAPTLVPRLTPSPTVPGTPRPTAFGNPDVTFDLTGTAWRLLELPGEPLTEETTPAIKFDRETTATGAGFSGCSPFSFSATFDRGRATITDVDNQDAMCRAQSVRDAFMPAFRATTTWAVFGDIFVLSGPAARLEFRRDLPPVGDPGRTLAQTLRVGEWRITSATGVRSPSNLALVLFSDHSLTSAGSCGFGSEVRFVPGGIKIIELGWDTDGTCRTDERPAFAQVMNAMTSGRVESSTRVRLAGPNGDVVLTRQ